MSEENLKRRTPRYGETQQIIAEIVKALPKGTHLTAPEVYERTKVLGVDISLSTVYRSLHRLKLHGNVSTVAGERGLRYETADEGPDHDHLICLGCGITIEFMDDLIRGFGKTVAERKGFEHTSSRFDILGYCSECNANDFGHCVQQSAEYLAKAMELIESSAVQLKQGIEFLDTRKLARTAATVQTAMQKLNKALTECENSLALIARDTTV
jgi:Fur family transcriptional regulator, ferric uptake regulator